MNIGLFTSTFFNNIGNAFIDYGAEETIKAAVPEGTKIVKLSGCANFAASLGMSFMVKENVIMRWLWEHTVQHMEKTVHDHVYNAVSTLNIFSPAKIALLDYLVIPGCVLTEAFFTIYGKLIQEKVGQGCRLIFLGASGNYYTKKEIEIVKKWLKRLKPYSLMFRDSTAYKHYAEYSSRIYNGIDNVFFINRLEIPQIETTMSPYVVLNFDLPKHKAIKKSLEKHFSANRKIVYTDHKPYPYIKVSRMAKHNVMCSDYPMDYLFIYRNTTETHSDRVHACIPTLSFGNKAQLYSDSPRIALFENVGIDIEEIKYHPVSLERDCLRQMQEQQIDFLKSVLR